MGSLQQFTADKRMLYAAIDKVKWNPLGTGGVSTFPPVRPTMEEDLKETAQRAAGGEAASFAFLTLRARALKLGYVAPAEVGLARSPLVIQAQKALA